MLNPNAKKWIAALRDPNTRQIKGTLETSEGQCVLGVPCRLYADENPEWPVTIRGINCLRGGGSTSFSGYQECLPMVVVDWLGLASISGRMNSGKCLDSLNDIGWTFPDLADLIESEPEGLFV